jgi:hypothetical protein
MAELQMSSFEVEHLPGLSELGKDRDDFRKMKAFPLGRAQYRSRLQESDGMRWKRTPVQEKVRVQGAAEVALALAEPEDSEGTRHATTGGKVPPPASPFLRRNFGEVDQKLRTGILLPEGPAAEEAYRIEKRALNVEGLRHETVDAFSRSHASDFFDDFNEMHQGSHLFAPGKTLPEFLRHAHRVLPETGGILSLLYLQGQIEEIQVGLRSGQAEVFPEIGGHLLPKGSARGRSQESRLNGEEIENRVQKDFRHGGHHSGKPPLRAETLRSGETGAFSCRERREDSAPSRRWRGYSGGLPP